MNRTSYRNQILSIEFISSQEALICVGNIAFYEQANFAVYLYSICYDDETRLCQLSATYTHRGVHIDDIGVFQYNKGYASKAMKCLIQLCKDNKIHRIYGRLTKFDLEDHGERLYAFYSKHGFSIKNSTNDIEKSIELLI